MPDFSALCNFEWRAIEKLVTQVSTTAGLEVRTISPMSAITADFNENRLNIILDDRGVVRGFDVG
jgi:hypothetical protein